MPVDPLSEDPVSDHQPEHQDDAEQPEAARQTAPDTATDPNEPDFSRLRMARASLDNAFPQK
jgi:hypothetical protein